MKEPLARIAKRILFEMLNLTSGKDRASVEQRYHTFIGLSLALIYVYEEYTGQSAKERKPKELMTWAMELPEPCVRIN